MILSEELAFWVEVLVLALSTLLSGVAATAGWYTEPTLEAYGQKRTSMRALSTVLTMPPPSTWRG